MHHFIPFGMALIIFFLTWITLLQLPYLEKVSINRAILYATISIFLAIIVFVMFAATYRYENSHLPYQTVKKRFEIKCDFLNIE